MPDICLQTIMLMDIDETLRAWHKIRDSTIFWRSRPCTANAASSINKDAYSPQLRPQVHTDRTWSSHP